MSNQEHKSRFEHLKGKLSYENPDLDRVIDEFIEWSETNQYLIFRKENIYTYKKEYKAVKAAKRGNDVYSWRLGKRLQHLYDLPEIQFFNPKDRNKKQKTRAIFITLTYRRDKRLDELWENVGSDFNRYLCSLKRQYGDFDILRCWEAQKDGYPHIHCVLLFEKVEFETFFYNGKWRLSEKDDLARNWYWGFSDVFALYSLGAGVGYVIKYVTKVNRCLRDEKVNSGLVLSLALMWVFKKRAFSVSRDFGAFLIEEKSGRPYGQVDLKGESIYKWYLVGFYTDLFGKFESWSVELSYREFWEIHSSKDFTFNKALL